MQNYEDSYDMPVFCKREKAELCLKEKKMQIWRWDCEELGCYREKCSPKLTVFEDCFPRKIAMGDIDGCVEIRGKFLFFEWKSKGGSLLRSQEIMFDVLVKKSPDFTVFIVDGDSRTMEVNRFEIWNGNTRKKVEGDLSQLKKSIEDWARLSLIHI